MAKVEQLVSRVEQLEKEKNRLEKKVRGLKREKNDLISDCLLSKDKWEKVDYRELAEHKGSEDTTAKKFVHRIEKSNNYEIFARKD